MTYNTRHGFTGYSAQVFPRAEKYVAWGYGLFLMLVPLSYFIWR